MPTMEAENKEIAVKVPDEVINEGNFDLIDEYCADDYIGRHSALPEPFDREGLKETVSMFRTAFPDLEVTFEEVIADGDTVVRRDLFTGTHEGELMGIEPTGREVEVQGISIIHFEDGKVVDERYQADNLGMMQQLGVIEPPGE